MGIESIRLKSAINEIQWPPIASPAASQILSVLHYLEQSQWWHPKKIQQHQFVQLFNVIQHALKTVPYYQSSLSHLKNISDANDLFNQWTSIPLLTRKALQLSQKDIYSAATLPIHGEIIPLTTSGSTGQPVTILTSGATQFFWQTFAMRDHIWHQRDFQGKLAIIRPSPDADKAAPHGKYFDNWGFTTQGITQTGPCWQLNTCTIDQEAEWLKHIDPHYLLCFPSTLKALIQYMQDNHIQLKNLKEVRTISEIVEPDLRELTYDKLNVPLKDTYSAKEIGYIAIQCPLHEHYHIQSENIFLEILNENNAPCEVGETGKVVITTLHNFASPLIRYEIGDYAVSGDDCSCQRGLPVLKSILGRQRNMLVLPDGRKTWPLFGRQNTSLNRLFPKCQFQLIQHSLMHLELKLTCSPCESEEEAYIKNQLQKILNHSFQINITYVNEIPRNVSGKYEDFKSEISSL
jgi:phenylacetate-CoA ligase